MPVLSDALCHVCGCRVSVDYCCLFFFLLFFFFFFSSRRRHTRYWRDWSSDVCSSDLRGGRALTEFFGRFTRFEQPTLSDGEPLIGRSLRLLELRDRGERLQLTAVQCFAFFFGLRSEERRVGKECRSRSSPDP